MYNTKSLFDLSHTVASRALEGCELPHLILPKISELIYELSASLDEEEYEKRGEGVFISRSARIERSAEILSPCIIGGGTRIRHGAFIREACIIGKDCVIGNSCEIKNSIIFDRCQIPHFNYVGDSILGYSAHLGAGAIISNLRSDKGEIKIRSNEGIIDTSLRKMGAMVGDFCEIGCNAVLCPGAVLERGAQIYPLALVRGHIQENTVFKG